MNKQLIREFGESAAYSAKCHYKSADFNKYKILALVSINIIFSALSILDLDFPTLTRSLGVISLIASIFIFFYESQGDKSNSKKHMKIGDEYLNIHNKLQSLFHEKYITKEEESSIKQKIQEMNKKDKPIINQFAKIMAKKAIEEKSEMIKWWKDDNSK